MLAEQGGDFVCATAGHHMEAMLAAYGSGAARVSHETSKRILNIDIGGGTTKLGLVESGRVDCDRGGAYRRPPAGGRRDGRIVRLDPAGQVSRRARPALPGTAATTSSRPALDKVAETMADTLVAAIPPRPLPQTSSISI